MENERKPSSVSISIETKKRLDSIRHKGQSYDGLLQELLDMADEYERETQQCNPNMDKGIVLVKGTIIKSEDEQEVF